MRKGFLTILGDMAASRRFWLKMASAPAVVTLAVLGLVSPGRAAEGRQLQINDNCDPATFNAAIPQIPNLCQGDGTTPFQTFFAAVGATGQAKGWNFKPETLHVKAGEPVNLINNGGETHTVTNVDAFGGGYIIPLNGLLAQFGLGTPRPECLQDGQQTVQIPGLLLAPAAESATNLVVHYGEVDQLNTGPGTPFPARNTPYLLECCVHPWMQTTLFVRPANNGKGGEDG
jgi:plastocyanin